MSILLLTANASEAEVMQSSLGNSPDGPFEVEWLSRCGDAMERLGRQREHEISAALLDLVLTDSRGIETFERLFRAADHVPFLILGRKGDEDMARLAVERGAQDFLLEERLDGYSLPKAVASMLRRAAHTKARLLATERAQLTLDSIGDAVLSTDSSGDVAYLNPVAARLTGWSLQDAVGRPASEVLRVIDAESREPRLNPLTISTWSDSSVRVSANLLLVRRDGSEIAVEDSAAPIHDRSGRVIGAVITLHDVGPARALSLRMSYLAQHDFLTGLPNRMLLNDRLAQAIAAALRHSASLAVLFLDVDHFKRINDSLGHGIGDRLLRSIALRLVGCVRRSDTISRHGGDEFIVLLSEMTHAQDAVVAAENIFRALRAPYRIGEQNLHVTVSMGISLYPHDSIDAETLLKKADAALFRVKAHGRDNYQFFESDMNLRVLESRAGSAGRQFSAQP